MELLLHWPGMGADASQAAACRAWGEFCVCSGFRFISGMRYSFSIAAGPSNRSGVSKNHRVDEPSTTRVSRLASTGTSCDYGDLQRDGFGLAHTSSPWVVELWLFCFRSWKVFCRLVWTILFIYSQMLLENRLLPPSRRHGCEHSDHGFSWEQYAAMVSRGQRVSQDPLSKRGWAFSLYFFRKDVPVKHQFRVIGCVWG